VSLVPKLYLGITTGSTWVT